jgi:hypothetical protein
MEAFHLDATKSTPLVDFSPETGVIEIKGECYPENAAKFFAPIFSWLEEYLKLNGSIPITVNMEMVYFNSSSSKALMNLMEILDKAASSGREVTINWRYHEENESAFEAGEEFREEISSLTFHLIEFSDED